MLGLVFRNLGPVITEDKDIFQARHRSYQILYVDIDLGIQIPELILFLLSAAQLAHSIILFSLTKMF